MSATAPATTDPTCVREGCIASLNPRSDSCCRCGAKIHVSESQDTGQIRDEIYETQFLENVEQEAQRRYGADAEGLANHVKYRLALGKQRYGDNDFLNKNLAREAIDEAFDLVAYPLLHAQKLLADPTSDDEQLTAFFDAAVFAAAAYSSLRKALAE